jgi:hypothetical protein
LAATSYAAVSAGLPADSVPALLAALAGGGAASAVPGATDAILAAATTASRNAYARAYRFAWAPIIPFVVVAMVCIACLKDVSELMTEHVEATVEHVPAARVGHGERDEEKATTSTSGN